MAHLTGKRFRFNTQPPEGGWFKKETDRYRNYTGFNTQPPEGGWQAAALPRRVARGFNTQPPEGGWKMSVKLAEDFNKFQHTAARRRLAAWL